MPGVSNQADMIGDYTGQEIAAMSRDDFEAAQAREFAKPSPEPGQTNLAFPVPAATTASAARGEIRIGSSVPARKPSGNVWASNAHGEDFVCPSGQTCKLRPLSPEKLLEAGLLDKISILEAMADKLAKASEGAPPDKVASMPTREEFGELMSVINTLVPLAVSQPTVWPLPAEGMPREDDRIYVDSIDLDDRMAIMNEALKGIRSLATFRRAG
jgi:hypothetical protein